MSDKKQEIILGLGKFSIYDGETKVPIAYTRGGGAFTVTRTYRPITFDGLKAYGSEDMVIIDEENVDMEINMLSIFTDSDLTFLYPAMKATTGADGTTITSNDDLAKKSEETDRRQKLFFQLLLPCKKKSEQCGYAQRRSFGIQGAYH